MAPDCLGEADRSVGSRYASASIRRRNLARIATNDDAAAGGASMHGSNQRGGGDEETTEAAGPALLLEMGHSARAGARGFGDPGSERRRSLSWRIRHPSQCSG